MATGLVNFAPYDSVLAASPDWTRLDSTYRVQAITVDRGRSFEFDTTGTGTATIQIVDTTGDFDPTNPGGAFYGSLMPYKQILVQLPDSGGSTWSPIFRGYVSRFRYLPYVTEAHGIAIIECVDLLDFLAGVEITGDGSYGDDQTNGNIIYNADTATTAAQTRITKVLNEVATETTGSSWPAGLRNIFTGNVKLQASHYSPRTSALAVIRDAADAEFPAVSNFFVSKDGVASFRGRYARFDYDDPSYAVDTWSLGDLAAADASPSTVVPISPPLEYSIDKENVWTAATATPDDPTGLNAGWSDGTNYVVDATDAASYGLRTWGASDLATGGGAGATTAVQETNLFADYILANYSTPRVRVGALTVRPQAPLSAYGDATWALFQGVEINDVVSLETTQGSGGFGGDLFFVEGIHYEVAPMSSSHPDVTLTLDVSPQAYFNTDSFR